MKRIFPLILTVLLIPALLAVPVMAADNGFWYELLDYGYSTTGSNYFSLPAVSSETYFHVEYPNPTKSTLERIEVIFRTDDPTPRISTSSNTLTIVQISDNLYRAYGRLGKRAANFGFYYDSGTYLEILSFKASTMVFDTFDTQVLGELFNYSDNNGIEPYTFNYLGNGEAVGGEFWTLTDFDNTFLSEMVVKDWHKYDYVDFQLALFCGSVNSVRAYLTDGSSVSVDVSTVLTGIEGNTNFYLLNVRCDLTEIVRLSPHHLVLDVSGSGVKGEVNGFWLYRASGILLPVTDNIFVYWFSQLKGWLDSGFSSILDALGGSNDASGVTDEINTAVGQLQQAGAALDSVQRPDLGKVDINVVGMVDPAGLSGVSSIVALFTGNSLIYTIMLMFLTLALISYILFGKR